MKIGFLTTYNQKTIEFASHNGFGSIELMISPGDPLDPMKEGKDAIKGAKEYIEQQGLEISAVGSYFFNCLDHSCDFF